MQVHGSVHCILLDTTDSYLDFVPPGEFMVGRVRLFESPVHPHNKGLWAFSLLRTVVCFQSVSTVIEICLVCTDRCVQTVVRADTSAGSAASGGVASYTGGFKDRSSFVRLQ